MSRIEAVIPLENYRLNVLFENGCSMILNLKPRLHTIRFNILSDEDFFRRAATDGIRIFWENKLEISINEVFQLAQK